MTNLNAEQEFIEQMAQVATSSGDMTAEQEAFIKELATKVEGQTAEERWYKPNNAVRMGKNPLPERVALYDTFRYDRSMVPPTIARARMMGRPGRYTMVKPADWDSKAPQPIDETCEVCNRSRRNEGNFETKKFYLHSDLITHYQLMHTLEWEAMRQDREEKARREDSNKMTSLIGALVASLNPSVFEKLPAEVKGQLQELAAEEAEKGKK